MDVIGSWWKKASPAVKGGILLFWVVMILGTIASLTRGVFCAFSFPMDIAVGLAQGVLVAKFAASQPEKYSPRDYIPQAILATVYASLIPVGFGLILGLLTGDVLMLPLLLVNLLQSMGAMGIHALAAAAGAWIYGRTGGKGMAGMLLGVGCIGSILIGVILAGVVALLAVIGINMVDYFSAGGFPWSLG